MTINDKLRSFLERILGFNNHREIDDAIRLIQMASTYQFPLILCGHDDLVSIARSLHHHISDGRFVVCDPRRKQTIETVRSAENIENGMVALAAANHGSLCIRAMRPPHDIDKIMRSPASVQIIVCSTREPYYIKSIRIPPLTLRTSEIDKIIWSYANDAICKLSAYDDSFTDEDHTWVKMHACDSLSDIEKATMRLVALRVARNRSNAAEILGMAPVSLARWKERREHVSP